MGGEVGGAVGVEGGVCVRGVFCMLLLEGEKGLQQPGGWKYPLTMHTSFLFQRQKLLNQ